MKYKVSKEELDALFREVYSTPTGQQNYTIPDLDKKEEYYFAAYKYKNTIKSYLVSHLPFKISLREFNAFEGTKTPEENLFISGYDIERKFRLFITASEEIQLVIDSNLIEHSFIKESFNIQSFIDSMSEHMVSSIKSDFPYQFRKIGTIPLQFYDDKFVKFSYNVEINDTSVNISIWFDKGLIETIEIPPIIYSTPTTAGKRNLKKLKDLLYIDFSVESEPVKININQLKPGQNITLKLNFKERIG